MKRVLLLLVFFATYMTAAAQEAYVELRLVNSEIGAPGWIGDVTTNISNDAGLNAILQQYEVSAYRRKLVHPYPALVNRTLEAVCAESNASALIAALSQYPEVVMSAHLSSYGMFDDVLTAQILTAGVGVPVAIEGNPVITNDAGLNQIFDDYNVYYFAQLYPSANSASLQRYYSVACNCDNIALKTALDNYDAVIEQTEHVSVGYELLSRSSYESIKTTVYPNPFTTTLNIETEGQVKYYTLFNLAGQSVMRVESGVLIEGQIQALSAGMYFLKLDFEDGITQNFKLIKN